MQYTGGCHCGKVRFEVNLKLDQVMACNCSICSKKGVLMSFAPASEFKLLSGQDSLGDYQFGAKRLHHYFCKNCGIGVFGGGLGPNGVEMRAINVRCLDGVDATTLPVQHFDGKSL